MKMAHKTKDPVMEALVATGNGPVAARAGCSKMLSKILDNIEKAETNGDWQQSRKLSQAGLTLAVKEHAYQHAKTFAGHVGEANNRLGKEHGSSEDEAISTAMRMGDWSCAERLVIRRETSQKKPLE